MLRHGVVCLCGHTADPEVKRFSNTVVEVKILDPDGTDLVFVDLPGMCASLASIFQHRD